MDRRVLRKLTTSRCEGCRGYGWKFVHRRGQLVGALGGAATTPARGICLDCSGTGLAAAVDHGHPEAA
jgi:hypothetical protein